MSATIRLRKMDFTTPAAAGTLALQRIHGSSCRAYWLKQALVAAGWTVYYSSDGISTGSSDLWTSSAFQAILMQGYVDGASTLGTVDGVWSCLRSPDVDANGDYLHICLSPSQAQWYNPAVRGPTNAMGTYGVPAKVASTAPWLTGYYNGFLRLGMTLSSSSTAFSGGAPYVSTDTATARGTLPSATGAFWTTHNLGSGSGGAAAHTGSMTVLTEGNQFHVLQENASTIAPDNRSWWSVCSLANGGYAVVERGSEITATGTGARGSSLVGGRLWMNQSPISSFVVSDLPTEMGGWRTGYVKRASGTLISGGLACPEPQGWEAVVDLPYFSTGALYPSVIKLQAVSCTDIANYNLGPFSDFVMMGNTRLVDLARILDSNTSTQWLAFKDAKANLLKWDWNDDHSLRISVLPPNSYV